MQTESLKLVTIVAESVLADSLVALLKRIGATGYTVTAVYGEGSRGMRTGEVPGNNQKIEVLVGASLASQIMDVLATEYFPNYAVAAWIADVSVVRGHKYDPPSKGRP